MIHSDIHSRTHTTHEQLQRLKHSHVTKPASPHRHTQTGATLSENRLFRLDDRIALVTGAAGHLGQAMVRGLCEAGAHVLLVGRTESKLAHVAQILADDGFSASVCPLDLTHAESIPDWIEHYIKPHGRLDVLVHNAYSGKAATIESDTIENFDAAYHLNVTMAFHLTQSLLPYLQTAGNLNAGGASVVHIASMYAQVSPDPSIYGESGQNNPPHYGAAKAGLMQLTRYLACHLAPQKIRVNSISPGPFPNFAKTREHLAAQPNHQAEIIGDNLAFHTALCQKVPMGRIGHPDELIGPLLFLASDASSYVTGANLNVDGGWTAW